MLAGPRASVSQCTSATCVGAFARVIVPVNRPDV
jgi:hypothetical protein